MNHAPRSLWWLLLIVGCNEAQSPSVRPATPSAVPSPGLSAMAAPSSDSVGAPSAASPVAITPSSRVAPLPIPSASTSPPPRPIVDLELALDRPRQVAPRFGGRGSETLQHFVLHAMTKPAQTLRLGDLRQTMCWLTRPEGAIVGVSCYSNAVGLTVTIEPAVRGVSRVVAEEGLESGRVLRHWVVGYLRLPADHDIHMSIVDLSLIHI